MTALSESVFKRRGGDSQKVSRGFYTCLLLRFWQYLQAKI